jgi:hypothetical protein
MRPLICATAIALAACYNNPNNDLTAASAGTLTGTVTSNAGSPLANVSVTADPQLGSPQTGASNGNGQYTIPNIPFGPGSVGVGGVPSGCQPTGAGYSMPSSFGTVYYTQYADSLLEFSATQLGNLAANATPKPVVSIGETITQDNAAITFGALAFDGSGNLWLGMTSVNGGGDVVRYPAGSLNSNGQPDITVANPNGTGYGTSLAFNPTPTGLPINGAHITTRGSPHIVQAKRAKQRYR